VLAQHLYQLPHYSNSPPRSPPTPAAPNCSLSAKKKEMKEKKEKGEEKENIYIFFNNREFIVNIEK
jgi:hypothetical protein